MIQSYASKVAHTLKHEGLVSTLARSSRYGAYRLRRAMMNKEHTLREWAGLKGAYAGKRAFLIGNGPSLNHTELYLLGEEATMCFNRFDLMLERVGWDPTFYMVIDDRVLLDTLPEVHAMSRRASHAFFPDIHPYNVDFRGRIEKSPHVHWLFLDRPGFSADLPYCGINKTVANVGIQVLVFLGFTEIYLLGVDMSYSLPSSAVVDGVRDVTATDDDDESHFDPRYFGRGRRFHVPMLEETFLKFGEAREFCESHGVSVMNATVGGALEEFPRVSLDAVLQLSTQDKRDRFSTSVRRRLSVTGDPLEMLEVAPMVEGPDDVDPTMRYFASPLEVVNGVILKHVFDYLPVGPLDGRVLFLRRDLLGASA